MRNKIDNKIILKSPFSVNTPNEAYGWENMYPYYLLFTEQNQFWEEKAFWFQDSMHHPEIQLPFETIIAECIRIGLSQNNSKCKTVIII
ncbi:hypothetical protein NOVO_08470 [Rickettsiales bacterium Ac37b]|nr:hypothetical protein NOVO_08470 [Rickettsiales bacterium Ac37b]